jgi:hypothetical protein
MAMINSFSLTAMLKHIESADTIRDKYEKIRDKIDYEHLGVSKYCCMRPIIGSIYACSALRNICSNAAKKELKKIESYISCNSVLDKNLYRFLVEHHWYVGGLVDFLSKFKEIQSGNTTGGLVDIVWLFDNPDKSKIETIIEKDTLYSFFSKKDFLSQFQKMRTIELSGYDRGPFVLELSGDEKYFRVIKGNEVIKVWNMQEAIPMTENKLNNITWTQFPKVSLSFSLDASSYSTDCFKVRILPEFPKKSEDMKFKITLTMKSFSFLYKCCCAFLNSNTKDMLIKLKESQSFQNVGFPRKNLEKLIDDKIEYLSRF